MSTNLGWLPVKPRKANYLPCALKFALQKRYGGYITGEVLTENDLSYLSGLDDAGVEGASDLLSAIEKYGQIEIFEE